MLFLLYKSLALHFFLLARQMVWPSGRSNCISLFLKVPNFKITLELHGVIVMQEASDALSKLQTVTLFQPVRSL